MAKKPIKYSYMGQGGALVYAGHLEGSAHVKTTGLGNHLDEMLWLLAEGGVVIDKRALVDDPNFVSWVFASPRVDLTLGAYTAVEGETKIEAASLDYVAAWWQTRGARVGKRRGRFIHWADGSKSPIARPANHVAQ